MKTSLPFRRLLALALIFAWALPMAWAGSKSKPPREPSLSGRRIARIYILRRQIFDTTIPSESKWGYRLVNSLHILSQDSTVRHQLLFTEGDRYDPDIAEETERALRRILRLREVHIRPMPVNDREIDVVVETQDTWSTEPYVSASTTGGETKYRFGIRERNLLGLGKQIDLSYKKDLDLVSRSISYDDPGLFGTRFRLSGKYEDTAEGSARALTVERPFFSSLTPFSFRGNGGYRKADTIFYKDGAEVARYTRENRELGAGFGVSIGSTPKRLRRLGLAYDYQNSRLLTGRSVTLPQDNKVYHFLGPTLEWSRVNFITTSHIRLYDRDEDFNLGPTIDLQMGYSSQQWSPDAETATKLNGRWSSGHRWGPGRFTLPSFSGEAVYENGWQNARTRIAVEHYHRVGVWSTWAGNMAWEQILNPAEDGQLLLGGDSGLRGYPINEFAGNRLFITNLENRFFLIDDIVKFFGLGAVVFADAGYVWPRGAAVRAQDIRADYGLGLRIHLSRASLGQVIRIDLAWPTHSTRGNLSPLLSIGTKQVF